MMRSFHYYKDLPTCGEGGIRTSTPPAGAYGGATFLPQRRGWAASPR